MGVKISGSLCPGFSTSLRHESEAEIKTTAPKDNGGDGTLFSPTDLLVASYGSCAATTMALMAKRDGISLQSVSWNLEKNMVSDPLRRIGSISGKFLISLKGDEEQFQRVAQFAHTCPVALSLSPQVELSIEVQRIS